MQDKMRRIDRISFIDFLLVLMALDFGGFCELHT